MSREPQDAEWFNGRIDPVKVREFARHDLRAAEVDEFFVCGPGTMGEDIPRVLAELGAHGRMHVEYFTPVAAAATSGAGAQAAPRPAPPATAASANARGHGRDGRPPPPIQHGARR